MFFPWEPAKAFQEGDFRHAFDEFEIARLDVAGYARLGSHHGGKAVKVGIQVCGDDFHVQRVQGFKVSRGQGAKGSRGRGVEGVKI